MNQRGNRTHPHDVTHLLQEQSVLLLYLGESILHKGVLLCLGLEVRCLTGGLVVDTALHVAELFWFSFPNRMTK